MLRSDEITKNVPGRKLQVHAPGMRNHLFDTEEDQEDSRIYNREWAEMRFRGRKGCIMCTVENTVKTSDYSKYNETLLKSSGEMNHDLIWCLLCRQ